MPVAKFFLFIFLILSFTNASFGQVDSVQRPEITRTIPVRPPLVQPETTRPAPVVRRIITAIDTARPDSTALIRAQFLRDSLLADSLQKITAKTPIKPIDTSTYKKYMVHPYLSMDAQPVFMLIDYRQRNTKDNLFYLMTGVLFCLGFIKAGFPRYFRNLFIVFFQANIRQKQSRDQLLQDNFASLLINLLFFISGGLYVALLIQYLQVTNISFWLLAPACALALMLIYLGKYLFLLFAGWVFNVKEAAQSYIFLVFLVNKVMGVLLVPFLLVLAFAAMPVMQVSLPVSFGLVGLMFVYRYFISFNAIQGRLKVNLLHFFLYLCAVEVLPLLLIYKLLINYFEGSSM